MLLRKFKDYNLGNGRHRLISTLYPLQMFNGEWLDINPSLLRCSNGWEASGVSFNAFIGDDGSRYVCPNKYEPSKYFSLPSVPLVSLPSKELVGKNIIRMLTDWGYIEYKLTNYGLKFSVRFNKDPKIDKFTFNLDTNILKEYRYNSRPRITSLVEKKCKFLEWVEKDGEIEVGFDFTGMKFPIMLRNATINVEPQASADDAGTDEGNWLDLDYDFWSMGNSAQDKGGVIFPVTIPSGATIDVAYITFHTYVYVSGTTSITVRWQAEETASPAQFSNEANFDARTLTTEYVDDTLPDLDSDEDFNTDSLVDPIQEWTTDHATGSDDLCMISHTTSSNSNYCTLCTYDEGTPAILHVEYTEAGPAARVPRHGFVNFQDPGVV